MITRLLILLFISTTLIGNSQVRSDTFLPQGSYNQQDTLYINKLLQTANTSLTNKNIKKAEFNTREAFLLSNAIGHKKLIAKSLFLIARIKHHEGLNVGKKNKNTMLAKSLNNYLEALKIFEKSKDSKYSARVNFQIGLLYKDWGKFHQRAINYFEIAYEQNGETLDIAQRIQIIIELCDSYVAVNNHEDVIGFPKRKVKY